MRALRALYDAVNEWMKPRKFDETTVKIEKVLADFNKDLPSPGYVLTAATASGNQYWCEHAPHLLLPPCDNRYKCKFCGKDVEKDPPCCDAYTGPKSNKQQATKTRVSKATLQSQSKIVNMRIEGGAGSMLS